MIMKILPCFTASKKHRFRACNSRLISAFDTPRSGAVYSAAHVAPVVPSFRVDSRQARCTMAVSGLPYLSNVGEHVIGADVRQAARASEETAVR